MKFYAINLFHVEQVCQCLGGGWSNRGVVYTHLDTQFIDKHNYRYGILINKYNFFSIIKSALHHEIKKKL